MICYSIVYWVAMYMLINDDLKSWQISETSSYCQIKASSIICSRAYWQEDYKVGCAVKELAS